MAFLHLLGYDHERSPAEARKMFARERELAALDDAQSELRDEARIRQAADGADPRAFHSRVGENLGAG